MSKRIWLLLLLAYGAVLLVTAPAGMLGTLLRLASNERIELANTDGTVWNGTANPVLHLHSGELVVLDRVQWKLALLKAFTGKLAIELLWTDAPHSFPMEAVIAPGQVELRHAHIPFPALLLGEVSAPLKPAALRGRIILDSDGLRITRQGILGSATADWINASSSLSQVSPLGNYHLTFTGTPDGLSTTLQTTSGALLLSGTGQFTNTTGLHFTGEAQASNGNEEALGDLLSHLGPQVRPGVHAFMLVPTALAPQL